MRKYRYTITINGVPKKPTMYTYKYGNTDGIVLKVSAQKAIVSFQMAVKKEFDDIILFRVKIAKDALRKMHLLHTLCYNSSLTVKRIIVEVDDEKQIYTEQTQGFPFFFSMLNSKNFGWEQGWNSDRWITVLSGTKTQTDNDYRFVALFSYLSGQSKSFEIDRFTCLWTAMNAHYNYIAKCYEDQLCHKHGYASRKEIKKQRLLENDARSIGALLRILECGEKKPTRDEKDANIKDYGALKEHLQQLTYAETELLYEDLYVHRKELEYCPAGTLGMHLKTCTAHARMSAYGYMLLEYAYYLRCRYIHGGKATVLFATYQDAELAALRIVNYFLSQYLKKEIPAMFDSDYFTEAMYKHCENQSV